MNITTPKGATGKEPDNFSATVANNPADSLVSDDATSDADFARTMQPIELTERLGEDGEEENEDLDQIREAKDGEEDKDNTSMKDIEESPGPKMMLDADGNEIEAPVIQMLDSTMGNNDEDVGLRLAPEKQSAEFPRENTPGFDEAKRDSTASGHDMKKQVESMLDA